MHIRSTKDYLRMAADLVDRFGQQAQPYLDYFLAEYEREQARGTARDRIEKMLGGAA